MAENIYYDETRKRWINRSTGSIVAAPTKKPVECPTGTEVVIREPKCDKSEHPDKCEKTMWGKPVQYCKKPPKK